ncbi:MAG: hypothetical protein ACTMIR_05315 [Cellulomonadaceae bacterium]
MFPDFPAAMRSLLTDLYEDEVEDNDLRASAKLLLAPHQVEAGLRPEERETRLPVVEARVSCMANSTRRRHTPGTDIATVLLMNCRALIGPWLASLYYVLRVGVFDNTLANWLGHVGEITDISIDPLPHGVPRGKRTPRGGIKRLTYGTT